MIDKKKADKIKEIIGDDKIGLDDDIKAAQEIGMLKGDKPKELIKALMEKQDDNDNDDDDDLPIFVPQKTGKYRIDEKQFALMFLEVFQHENIDTGEFTPKYRSVSRMLGIPRTTLKSWWDKKEELEEQHSALMDGGIRFISTSLMVESIRMLQALNTVDYKEMFSDPKSFKNYITLLNTMMNKVRLFTGKSTSNVEHRGLVALVTPEEEE